MEVSSKNLRREYYLSEERDFPYFGGDKLCNYVICSSPRSGSTLLAQMLYDTKLAGDPLEYINPMYIMEYNKRFAGSSYEIYSIINNIKKIRTSPNGYFGIKLHFSQFYEILNNNNECESIKFLSSLGKIIFIRRKNKLSQGISLYRSEASDIWSSIDENYRDDLNDLRQKIIFDRLKIFNSINRAVWQDSSWNDILNKYKFDYYEVYYEDLCEDWVTVSQGVLRYLGLNVDRALIPAPALRKLAPEDDDLVRQMRAYLGL